jgi:hypothetical protein
MELTPDKMYYSVFYMDGRLSTPLIQSLIFRRYEKESRDASERWLLFDQVSVGYQATDGLMPIRIDESNAEACIYDLMGLCELLREVSRKN